MTVQSSHEGHERVLDNLTVDAFTDGVLGPEVAMLGPVADGGTITWRTAPGCWGP